MVFFRRTKVAAEVERDPRALSPHGKDGALDAPILGGHIGAAAVINGRDTRADREARATDACGARASGGALGSAASISVPLPMTAVGCSQLRPAPMSAGESRGTTTLPAATGSSSGDGGGASSSAAPDDAGGMDEEQTRRKALQYLEHASVNDFISKAKSQRKDGLGPSGPELFAYARYLGIDPLADHDLLWMAEEALCAPMPIDWTEQVDGHERTFYYNAKTKTSSWTHPMEHIFREAYQEIVRFRNAPLSPAERLEQLRKMQLEGARKEQEVHDQLATWSEHDDGKGHVFFHCTESSQSSWTDPRPAMLTEMRLHMRLLRFLDTAPLPTASGGSRPRSAKGPVELSTDLVCTTNAASSSGDAEGRPESPHFGASPTASAGAARTSSPGTKLPEPNLKEAQVLVAVVEESRESERKPIEDKAHAKAKRKRKRDSAARSMGHSQSTPALTSRPAAAEDAADNNVDPFGLRPWQGNSTKDNSGRVAAGDRLPSKGHVHVSPAIRLQPLTMPTTAIAGLSAVALSGPPLPGSNSTKLGPLDLGAGAAGKAAMSFGALGQGGLQASASMPDLLIRPKDRLTPL